MGALFGFLLLSPVVEKFISKKTVNQEDQKVVVDTEDISAEKQVNESLK